MGKSPSVLAISEYPIFLDLPFNVVRHHTFSENYFETLQYLLKYTNSTKLPNDSHKPTLLFHGWAKPKYLELILGYGVDIHVRNDEQKSVLDLTLSAGNAE